MPWGAQEIELYYQLNSQWRLVSDEQMRSARKRRETGLQALDQAPQKTQNTHSHMQKGVSCVWFGKRFELRGSGADASEITCTESHLQVTQLFMRSQSWRKWKENRISCGARFCDRFPFDASHRRPLAWTASTIKLHRLHVIHVYV